MDGDLDQICIFQIKWWAVNRDANLLAICDDRTYRPIALIQPRGQRNANRSFDASHHVGPLGRWPCRLGTRRCHDEADPKPQSHRLGLSKALLLLTSLRG